MLMAKRGRGQSREMEEEQGGKGKGGLSGKKTQVIPGDKRGGTSENKRLQLPVLDK